MILFVNMECGIERFLFVVGLCAFSLCLFFFCRERK